MTTTGKLFLFMLHCWLFHYSFYSGIKLGNKHKTADNTCTIIQTFLECPYKFVSTIDIITCTLKFSSFAVAKAVIHSKPSSVFVVELLIQNCMKFGSQVLLTFCHGQVHLEQLQL